MVTANIYMLRRGNNYLKRHIFHRKSQMWTVFETERRKGERLTVTAIHVVESNEKADAESGRPLSSNRFIRDFNNLCCLLDFCSARSTCFVVNPL